MTGLPIKAGCGDVAGSVMSAGGQQDEVTGESLILPHYDDVPHLPEREGHVTRHAIAFASIINERVGHVKNQRGKDEQKDLRVIVYSSLRSCITDYASGAA